MSRPLRWRAAGMRLALYASLVGGAFLMRRIFAVLATLAVVTGIIGILASFPFFAAERAAYIAAGASGLVIASILIGAGSMALSTLPDDCRADRPSCSARR